MPFAKQLKGLSDFYRSSGNEYDDTYGDDFDEDVSSGSDKEKDRGMPVDSKNHKSKGTEAKKNRGRSSPFSKDMKTTFNSSIGSAYSEPLTSPRNVSGVSYKRSYGTGSTSNRKKDRRKGQREVAYRPPQNNNMVVKRVLSANRNKLNSLQNLVLELQSENEQLRLENRDLKRSSKMQEKAIKKMDNEEAELPLLLQKHNSEVKFLKDKLKRFKEDSNRTQDEIKKKDLENLKLRDKVKKYEEIMKEKNLDERDRLQQKLQKLERELFEKEEKVSELEKIVRLSEKVRIRELKEKNDKYKKAIDELRRLEGLQRDLQEKFKEKEKELEVQNIYSQRINLKKKVNRSQQPSIDSHLLENIQVSSRISDTPKIASFGFENERTESKSKDNELSRDARADLSSVNEDVTMETMVSALRKKEEELEMILEEDRKRKQFEEDKMRLREMEERIRQKQDEIADAERRKKENAELDERRQLEEQQRRRKEKEQEDRRLMEELSKRRNEELLVIEKLELEKKAEENSIKLKADRGESNQSPSSGQDGLMRMLAEQQNRKNELEAKSVDEDAERKKQLLIARMKAIDDGKDPQQVKEQRAKDVKGQMSIGMSYSTAINGTTTTTNEKKKPIFLENGRPDNDDDIALRHPPLDFSSKRKDSKEYVFKDTDNNLHQGLPSHPDLVHKKNSKQSDDLVFGSYSPTVHSGGKKRTSRFENADKNTEKKDDFLFETKPKINSGNAARRREKTETEDFLFFNTKEAKEPVGKRNGTDDNLFSISSDKKKQSGLNRNRTQSISDDDSQMFTIGGKGPEKSKSGTDLSDKANKKPSKPGSGAGVYGSYEPTFGNSGSANSNEITSPDSDPFFDDGPRYGRRRGQQKNSGALGDNIFTENKNKTNLHSTDRKDVVSNGPKPGTIPVRAVDSFADDDIEEMVLT